MKLLIDMNLSPNWVSVLAKAGWSCAHWSDVGDRRANDHDIFDWAIQNRYVVFTNDLDFGEILAATGGAAPSVIQLRLQRLLPSQVADLVVEVLRQSEPELERGALIVVEEARTRIRILPLP